MSSNDFYVKFTAGSGKTITLPLANGLGLSSHPIVIKNTSGNNVTISRLGADTVDGGTTITLATATRITLYNDGVSAWESN